MSPSSSCPLTQNCSLNSQSCCCRRMNLNNCTTAPLMCVSLSESLVPDGWLKDQGCRGVERFFSLSAEFWSLWRTRCHSALHCHDCSLCVCVCWHSPELWLQKQTVRTSWPLPAWSEEEEEVVMDPWPLCQSSLLLSIHRPPPLAVLLHLNLCVAHKTLSKSKAAA